MKKESKDMARRSLTVDCFIETTGDDKDIEITTVWARTTDGKLVELMLGHVDVASEEKDMRSYF